MANDTIYALDRTPAYVPYNATYRRTKGTNGITESSAYLKRYYSSIDAELYFGNEYVEDITDISYSVSQSSLPIFGYNSYTYDALVVGARYVQGQFSIRFTSPNYLFDILRTAIGKTIITEDQSYVVPVKERVYLEAAGQIDTTFYGARNDDEVAAKFQELWPETFDIDIVYGGKSNVGKEVHVVIENVRILSVINGASVSNPTPLTETYSFVAQDIKTIAYEDATPEQIEARKKDLANKEQDQNQNPPGAKI